MNYYKNINPLAHLYYLSGQVIRNFSCPLFPQQSSIRTKNCHAAAYSLHNERVWLIKSDFSFLSQGRSPKTFMQVMGGSFSICSSILRETTSLQILTMSELSPQGFLAFFLVKMLIFLVTCYHLESYMHRKITIVVFPDYRFKCLSINFKMI